MPSTLNAPGIYIEELPSGVRPIVGVSTSDTAFVDWFPRGPIGDADPRDRAATTSPGSSVASTRRARAATPSCSTSCTAVRSPGSSAPSVDNAADNAATLDLKDSAGTPKVALTVDRGQPGHVGQQPPGSR